MYESTLACINITTACSELETMLNITTACWQSSLSEEVGHDAYLRYSHMTLVCNLYAATHIINDGDIETLSVSGGVRGEGHKRIVGSDEFSIIVRILNGEGDTIN